jgi:concentrative nucleoside transporter, CNT family
MKKFLLLLMLAGLMPGFFSKISGNPTEFQSLTAEIETTAALKAGVGSAAEYASGNPILPDKTRNHPFSLLTLIRGMIGMLMLIGLGYLLSHNRKQIPWKVVFTGIALQILLAAGVLYVPFVRSGFEFAGQIFVLILDFTKAGSVFLLGDLMDTNTYGYIFLFQVLPTIIFFSALTSLLFYWGVIQRFVWMLAWIFTRALNISGAEALSVAGNIFLGQTESPLMIKAYLPRMGNSEILLVMTGGMATLAGGVLAAYIAMLGGDDPVLRLEFAKHLLTASVMAAPAAVVFSKMIVPPDSEINREVEVPRERIGSNVLDAVTNGTSEGVKLAVNVAAMLLAFVAFIAMFNFLVGKAGQWTSLNEVIASATGGRYNELSLQFILGYSFAPLMWLIGISPDDVVLVGRLLGEKLILTEFIGYISLAELKTAGVFASDKSVIMATYMLCGFANVASIGIQIGGIGSLAPNKRVLLSKYGVPALIAGTLTSLMSATIIGMLLG